MLDDCVWPLYVFEIILAVHLYLWPIPAYFALGEKWLYARDSRSGGPGNCLEARLPWNPVRSPFKYLLLNRTTSL